MFDLGGGGEGGSWRNWPSRPLSSCGGRWAAGEGILCPGSTD